VDVETSQNSQNIQINSTVPILECQKFRNAAKLIDPWRGRHNIPLKYWDVITHSTISYKNKILFRNVAMVICTWTLGLQHKFCKN
jgi:hypothetical protein